MDAGRLFPDSSAFPYDVSPLRRFTPELSNAFCFIVLLWLSGSDRSVAEIMEPKVLIEPWIHRIMPLGIFVLCFLNPAAVWIDWDLVTVLGNVLITCCQQTAVQS